MRDNYLVLALYQVLFVFVYVVNISNIIYYKRNEKELKRRYWGKNKIDPSDYWTNIIIVSVANIFILSVTLGWI